MKRRSYRKTYWALKRRSKQRRNALCKAHGHDWSEWMEWTNVFYAAGAQIRFCRCCNATEVRGERNPMHPNCRCMMLEVAT